MSIISQFLFSCLSTIGFSILFNIPKDLIVISGVCGALGWTTFIIIKDLFGSIVIGTFFGAISVGIIGEILAKKYRKPATAFIIPGIVPLVPGAGTYYTMFALIQKNFHDAATFGTETLFTAAAIAAGITISSALSGSIKRVKQ
jgi:uncharacterized membrane protein YjjB (DUF3815 family)